MTIRPPSDPPKPSRKPDESDDLEGEASDLELDDAISLPELDGDVEGEIAQATDELTDADDEHVGLDDSTAEEAAEAVIDVIADVEAEGWETSEDDEVDADDDMSPGESESWTEGSEGEVSTPIDLEDADDPEGGGDTGEEGIEDDLGELELPPRAPDAGDESYPEELDLA